MTERLRAVAWNCRRAVETSAAWEDLLELCRDVVLLQGVGAISGRVLAEFAGCQLPAMGKGGTPQKFGTALLEWSFAAHPRCQGSRDDTPAS